MDADQEREQRVINWLAKINFGDSNGHYHTTPKAEMKIDYEAWFLEGSRIKGCETVLVEFLRTRDHRVNLPQVAFSLGRVGGKETVVALTNALSDENSLLRTEAVSSLGLLGDKTAVQSICETLTKDSDHNVRANACVALGKLGDLRAKPFLERALKDKNDFVAALAKEALDRLTVAGARR